MRHSLAWSFGLGVLVGCVACGSSGGGAVANGDAGGSGANADAGGSTADAGATTGSDGGESPPLGGDDAGTAGGDASQSAPSDAGLDGGEDAALPDGSLVVQFVTSDETVNFDKSQEEKSTGTIAFGVADTGASDGIVGTLTRTGGQSAIGTSGAEEIVSQRAFSFGTFHYRFNLASCATSEELVNGIFTYFNDGTKAADGNVINREVDIEILCGEPWLINLTIWTEYTDDTHLMNQARTLDTRTGTLYVFANDSQGDETGSENHPELIMPGFPVAGTFYEMGFTWTSTSLTYFMVNQGTTLTLWEATDATRIPQLPMEQHFNVWAPGEHWLTGTTASPPANDATLSLDWFSYEPL